MPVIQNRKSSAEIEKGNLNVLTLSEAEVKSLLDPQAFLSGLEEGFKALTGGDVQTPDRPEIVIPGKGFILSMPAFQQGAMASVKMVSVFEGNLGIGLPNHLAVINLFDAETGKPVCFMDGTYITAIRTSASAILSVKLLSRPESRTATILGAGVQGREHLRLLPMVRDLERIFIGSLHFSDSEKLARQNERAVAIQDFEAAVRESDIVCLCSHSYHPIIEKEWLKEGAHVSSVGYAPPEGELPRSLVREHRLFVETRAAFKAPPVGCAELSGIDPGSGTELGEVLLRIGRGRESKSEITVYKAMGSAMEDMVAANLAYQRAVKEGVGTRIVL